MRTWLDFLFQCLDALNRIGKANEGVINIVRLLIQLRTLALREIEANKEQQKESKTAATIQLSEEQFITLVSRIVAAVEANATRTSQPKESLTAVEDLPLIQRTRLLSPLPQFLPLRAIPERCLPLPATPGGLPMEHFLPRRATPERCLPLPAPPSGVPLERCLPLAAIPGGV